MGINILWLSDIHIDKTHKINYHNFLYSYFTSIFKEVDNNAKKQFDYILISGDLVYSGDKLDFIYFNEIVVKILKQYNTLKSAHILTVPGNHDIKKLNVDWIIKVLSRKKNKRDSNLLKIKEDNFKPYIDYIKSIHPKEDDNFEILTKDSNWCLIDKKNKLNFILLNSAYFSIGNEDVFDEELNKQINNIIDDQIKFEETQTIKDSSLIGKLKMIKEDENLRTQFLLEIKKRTGEYQSQELNAYSFNEELRIVENVFEKYKGNRNIIIYHHPSDWLHWEEKYNYDEDIHVKLPYNEIMYYSHVILNSHNHLPINTKADKMEKGVFALNSGSTLDLKPVKEPCEKLSSEKIVKYNKENWISTIEINHEILIWSKHKIEVNLCPINDLIITNLNYNLIREKIKLRTVAQNPDLDFNATTNKFTLNNLKLHLSNRNFTYFNDVKKVNKNSFYYIEQEFEHIIYIPIFGVGKLKKERILDCISPFIEKGKTLKNKKIIIVLLYLENNSAKYFNILSDLITNKLNFETYQKERKSILNEFELDVEKATLVLSNDLFSDLSKNYNIFKMTSLCHEIVKNHKD